MSGVTRFQLPTRVEMGNGVAGMLLGAIQDLQGDRIFVVTDAGLRATGIVERVLAPVIRAGIPVEIWDRVSPNPRDHECRGAADAAIAFRADLIVAIGGGSPIDTAKTVAGLVTNGGRVQDWEWPRAFSTPPLPLIAIPTTAGTGSEVTFYAVVTDTERQFKMSLFDLRLAPRIALVDPELTLSLPPAITAATGMDALTHAIEAYTGRPANPVSDALALQAVRLIAAHLPAAVADGSDLAAREAMMTASLLAGMAFGNADVGSVHCLAEAIGGRYDTPHGVANSVFLPHVFAHNAEAFPERHADVAEALGIDQRSRSVIEVAVQAVDILTNMARTIGIPHLSDLAVVDPVDFDELATASAANVSNASNCRAMQADDYRHLLQVAWDDRG